MIERARKVLAGLGQMLAGLDVIDLAIRLSLLDLLYRPVGPWYIRPFILLLAGLGVFSSEVRRSALTWLLLAFLTGWRVVADWPMSDNHAYLLCYWCLAIFCSRLSGNFRASLALNARLLIGMAFLFAIVWKVFLSPDYLDGTFFRVTFLTDERFTGMSRLIGGMSEKAIQESASYLEPLLDGAELFDPPRLMESSGLIRFAFAATWWTLLMEAAVAICFLGLGGPWLFTQRHLMLLAFCSTTYAFAPVAGFGWLLMAMGIAQCEAKCKTIKNLYLACFFLILFYREIPWATLLADWLNG